MLKSIYNFSLMDLLPDSLTRDPQIRACIEGLDEELRKLSIDIRETLILSRIDEISEDVIDLLAWQFNVPFYQPAELDLTTKRELVKNAIADHRIRGTPAAVEKLLTTVFNNAVVKEWWEFNGDPYTFRIEQLGRSLATEQDFADFELALDVSKNTRSHLESFTVKIIKLLEILYGFVSLQSKTRRKLYRIDDSLATLNSMLGFADIRSLYRIDKPRIGSYIPPMTNYLGFINQKHLYRMNPALDSDLPVHDLRSTAVLDLLILGLGILRESLLESKPIWSFSDHILREFFGMIQSRDIRKTPSHSINFTQDLQETIGFIRSKEVNKIQRPKLDFCSEIDLYWYIFATKLVARLFHTKPELPIDATISKALDLHNFFGFVSLKSEYRRKIPIPNLDSDLQNYIGAINLKAISKRKILDVIEKEPILYHHDAILNIFLGFSRLFAEKRRKLQYPRTSFNIDLSVAATNSRSLEKVKIHRVEPIQDVSKVHIGAIYSRFAWKKFKPMKFESFHRKQLTLPRFIGFSRFKHIHHEIRDSTILRGSRINLAIKQMILRSLMRKNLLHDSIETDRNIIRNSILNLTATILRFACESRFNRNIPKFTFNLRRFYGLIRLRSISKHLLSRDSPSHRDEMKNREDILRICDGFVTSRAVTRSSRTSINSENFLQIFLSIIHFRSINIKHPTLSTKSNLTLPIDVGCLSFRMISRRKISEYHLGLIHTPTPNLDLFASFVRIRSYEKKRLSHRSLDKSLNITVGIYRLKIVRRENHAISTRETHFGGQMRFSTKMVIYARK